MLVLAGLGSADGGPVRDVASCGIGEGLCQSHLNSCQHPSTFQRMPLLYSVAPAILVLRLKTTSNKLSVCKILKGLQA